MKAPLSRFTAPDAFVCLALLLILISIAIHARHIDSAFLPTADDIRAELKAHEILRGGWKTYWDDADGMAVGQGRFYFTASISLFYLPYIVPDGPQRVAIIVAIQFASLLALALYLRRHLSDRTFWLFLALLCALLPIWNRFHPLTTLPVFYQAPVLLFFSSMVLRARTLRSRPLVRWSYLAPLFASLWFYEALFLPFLVIALLEELLDVWVTPPPPGMRISIPIRTIAPVLLVFAFWALLFAGYRQVHHSNYPGSRLAPFSPAATLRGVAAFSGEGIPGMNLLQQTGLIPEIAGGFSRDFGLPRILLAHLSAAGWAQAMLALALGFLYVWSGGEPPASRGWVRPAIPGLLCVVIALLLPLPLTITEKYRDTAVNWAPYMPGYYAFLAWVAGFAFSLERRPRFSLGIQRLARVAGAAVLGLGCFGLVAATAIANDTVSAVQAHTALKWKVVNAALQTHALDRLAPNSVVLAPALWEGLPHVDWIPYEDYWTRYVDLHSGRRLIFARTPEEAGVLKNPPPAYYAVPIASGCSGDGLLITRIVRNPTTGASLLSDEAILVSKSDPVGCDLLGAAAGEPGDLLRDGDPSVHLRLPRAEVQSGLYVVAFKTAPILAGSAALVPHNMDRWPGVSSVEMEFHNGFSGRESDGNRFWIWSDGSSGKGEMNFQNNTSNALAARFHSLVITGPGSSRFETQGAGRRASEILANRQLRCDWVFHLQPGANQVHVKSFAPRLVSAGDPRYIVFGFENWSLIPCDRACVDQCQAARSPE